MARDCTDRKKEAKKKSNRFVGGERRAIACLTAIFKGDTRVSKSPPIRIPRFQALFFLDDLRNSIVRALSLSRT